MTNPPDEPKKARTKADTQLPAKTPVAETLEPGQTGAVKRPEAPRSNQVIKEILGGNAMVSVLAVVLALLVGSILIVATDEDVQATAGYFLSRPGDLLGAIGR